MRPTMQMKSLLLGLLAWLLVVQSALCFYNPTTGRWLSRDPLGEAGGCNLHGFTGNEPIANADLNGLVQITGPSYIYGTANGPIGPGTGGFGLTRWSSGVGKLKKRVECNLCCLDEVEFYLNLKVFLPVVGDVLERLMGFPGGSTVKATAQYVQNIAAHEQVHVQHALALANSVFPAIESNCSGRCWRKPGGGSWKGVECYDFLLAKMRAYDDMVTGWHVELGNDWHSVHLAKPGGRNSYQIPVTAAHLSTFQAIQDRKITDWAGRPWCSDGDTCGRCIGGH